MRNLILKVVASLFKSEVFEPDSGSEIIFIPKPASESESEYPKISKENLHTGKKKPSIQRKLLPINRFSRSGKNIISVKGIVVHWVANPRASAAGIRQYFSQLDGRYASTHYVVGKEGEIIMMIPENEIGYHVGASKYMPGISNKFGRGVGARTPNYTTLGIECCHEDWSGKMSRDTMFSLKYLCAKLLKKYKLTVDELYLHYHFTGKKCHRWFMTNPEEWIYFKEDVSIFMETV